MKTRTELWRQYRKEINNNIKLQEDANFCDEKLTLLNKRLLDVFPDYDKKFKFKIKNENNDFFKEINRTPHLSLDKINKLKSELDNIDYFPKISKSIDNIDFSSHELDYIIEKIKARNNSSKNVFLDLMNENQKDSSNKNINHTQKIQVAIDGPSGSGKSTVSKLIAKKYKLLYINTGLVYRAIAFNAVANDVDLDNENAVFATLYDQMFKLENNEKIFFKAIDITEKLRTNEVSQFSSRISVHPKIRQWATNLLQEYAQKGKIIMDGRDVTFNIMPHANIKIFLETDIETRTKRRSEENIQKGIESDYSKIFKEIKERDDRDKNRKINPLHQTENVHLIDATNLSIQEVFTKISAIIDKEIK